MFCAGAIASIGSKPAAVLNANEPYFTADWNSLVCGGLDRFLSFRRLIDIAAAGFETFGSGFFARVFVGAAFFPAERVYSES